MKKYFRVSMTESDIWLNDLAVQALISNGSEEKKTISDLANFFSHLKMRYPAATSGMTLRESPTELVIDTTGVKGVYTLLHIEEIELVTV